MVATTGTALAAPVRTFARTDAGTATPAREQGDQMTDTAPRTGYAPVNDLEMYHEIHGTGGVPLMLLHGGFSTINIDFGRVLPALSTTRQVIGVEQQGHGHTGDIDRPLRYDLMADDTIALLEYLEIDQADLFGYSIGSAVALEVATKLPDLVRKLVLATVIIKPEGFHPELLAGLEHMTVEMLAGSPFHEEYLRVAPNPDAWPDVFAKKQQMDREWTGWPDELIGSITAPALIIAGDADIVRPEHAVEVFRLFGGGVAGDMVGLPPARLAVLPGTTHITLVHRGEWLASMVAEFLDAPMPEAG